MKNSLTTKNKTITSLELLDKINFFRKKLTSKNNLKHHTLLEVIRDEFEEEIAVCDLSECFYDRKYNKNLPMFELTVNQAKRILARESKIFRKAVINEQTDLEIALNKNGYIISDKITKKQLKIANEEINIKQLTLDYISEEITMKYYRLKINEYLSTLKLEKREKEIRKIDKKLATISDMALTLQVRIFMVELYSNLIKCKNQLI